MKRTLPLFLLLLAGCDGSVPPPDPTVEERQPNPAFETQIQAVDKARAVDGQLQEAAEMQRRQIDEAAK